MAIPVGFCLFDVWMANIVPILIAFGHGDDLAAPQAGVRCNWRLGLRAV